jgi:hypothetical protein
MINEYNNNILRSKSKVKYKKIVKVLKIIIKNLNLNNKNL